MLGTEVSGYGDPTLSALRSLSAGGGACAVVRDNVQAQTRFGCARDGEVLFDADEYTWIEDPGVVPAELRPLFDLAWDDSDDDDADDDADDEADEDSPSPYAVGLAMAEVVTGLRFGEDQLHQLTAGPYFAAPTQRYPDDG